MIHDAHAFRGEYIDVCAQIEAWAVNVIRSTPAQRSGKAAKMPHLLGQKLRLVADLAAEDAVFAKPARVQALLLELEPLMRLRSDLAHAVLSCVAGGDGEIYAFALPTASAERGIAGQFWLSHDDAARLTARLKQSVKELRDQKLKL